MKRGSVSAAADALLAFRKGDDTPEARAGAMLVGETFMLIQAFLTPKKKT